MFGDSYKEREYNQFVAEGDYMVRLGLPQDVQKGNYHIREIPIEIKGHSGYGPDKWSIFDADTSDQEKLENWQKARTRDADAFGVKRGDFNPNSWRGKTGMVHIGKDAKGYMKVMYSLTPDAIGPEHSAPTPSAPAAAPAKQPQNDWGQPAKKVDDFTDEIPF
jgi:hypothetical protein